MFTKSLVVGVSDSLGNIFQITLRDYKVNVHSRWSQLDSLGHQEFTYPFHVLELDYLFGGEDNEWFLSAERVACSQLVAHYALVALESAASLEHHMRPLPGLVSFPQVEVSQSVLGS